MEKIFYEKEIKTLIKQVHRNQISFGKMVELLNLKVEKFVREGKIHYWKHERSELLEEIEKLKQVPPTAEAKIKPLKKPYQPDEYMPETWKNDPETK